MMESVLLLYNVALFLGRVWRHKFEPVVRKITDGEIATGGRSGGARFPLHVNKAVAPALRYRRST